MKLEFQKEELCDELAVEIDRLLSLQWMEIGSKFILNINWASYFDLAGFGILRIFTIRANGKLVGYSSFNVIDHIHHAGVILAAQDSIYLLPDYRGSEAISGLIDFFEEQLFDEGVDHVTGAVKPGRDYSSLLMKRGYEQEETVYLKVLGG